MNTITYLISQAENFYQEKEFEIGASYSEDAWISLKEYLSANKVYKTSQIKFSSSKDTDLVLKWLNTFYIGLINEKQFKVAITILNDMLAYFDFDKTEKIIKNRALAEQFYNIKDYESCINLYKEYIKKYPQVIEYYYGYGLVLNETNEKVKAINILEEGIENNPNPSDIFLKASRELLIEIYESLNEEENAERVRMSNLS